MSVIATFPWGFIATIGDNEVEIVSTMKDPPKVRLAVEHGKVESNLGSVCFNLRRPDGTHDEMGYVMGRLTADKRAGAMYVALAPRLGENCREVLYLDPQAAIFRVPVFAPNLGSGGGSVTRFYSDDRKYCYNVQGDPTPEFPHGRIVQLEIVNPSDESTWIPRAELVGRPL